MATLEPINETFAIIFSNVPSNYTCKDVLINHLNSKNNGKKSDISAIKLNRWRRALRLINIHNHQCVVVFSSIFYWCKYSRLVSKNENVSIHPKYYSTIRRPNNIDFISSNFNKQLIKLFNLPQDIVSYSFICNQTLFISTKMSSEQELLIKIPTQNISNIKFLAINNNNEEKDNVDTEMLLQLNKNCQLFEYYHRHKLWKCMNCSTVNKINDENEHKMQCNCCDNECSKNNNYHYYHINDLLNNFSITNPDLKVKKFQFVQQTVFYRKISSFDTNIASDDIFHILSPLMNVLDDNKRDIPSALMFTNHLSLKYNHKMDLNIYRALNANVCKKTDSNQDIDITACKHIDFPLLTKAIRGTFAWLAVNRTALIFPVLSILLRFPKPGCFCSNLEEYVDKIDELCEDGFPQWLLKEALLSLTNMDVGALEQKVEALEQYYDDKGVVSFDEDEKEPCCYEVQLSPFNINIIETDFEVEKNEEWQAMNRVSTSNYIISFMKDDHGRNICYDSFKNIKQRMQFKSYLLIDSQHNEIMHYLHQNAQFVQYGATILNNPLSDEKFLEYYKRETLQNDNDKYEQCDDSKYVINNYNIYHHQPPAKKIKMNTNRNTNINVDIPQRIPKKNHFAVAISKQIVTKNVSANTDIEAVGNTVTATPGMPNTENKKSNGRKRKLGAILDAPSPRSRSPTPVPKSFMQTAQNKVKTEQTVKTEAGGLVIADGVGMAYGVPIYNETYFECAQFETGDKFAMHEFADLCVDIACRSDLKIMRDLRRTAARGLRRREITKPLEAESQFLKGVPDRRYIDLFVSCFTSDEEEQLEVDWRDYIRCKDRKKYVVYNIGYDIKKDMKFRLYTLMRIYNKHITWGILHVDTEKPPWLESDDVFMFKLCGQIKCIDLTDVASDDDGDEDYDIYMANNNGSINYSDVKVKQEFGDEYDSESE